MPNVTPSDVQKVRNLADVAEKMTRLLESEPTRVMVRRFIAQGLEVAAKLEAITTEPTHEQ